MTGGMPGGLSELPTSGMGTVVDTERTAPDMAYTVPDTGVGLAVPIAEWEIW